jgi:hypothetical protein
MKFIKDFLTIFLYLFYHLSPIWGFLSVTITLLGLVLSKMEGISIGSGIYLAWITATTVGFGDITPVSGASRVLCVFLAIIGIINTGIILSIALNASRGAMERNLDMDKLKTRINKRIT